MRIILILTLFISIYSFGQTPTGFQYRMVKERTMAAIKDSVLVIPRYTDTTAANLHKGVDSSGAIIYTYTGNTFWGRKHNPKRWEEIGGSSTNFANSNLTQTAARTYAGAGFNYTLNDLGHWTFNMATGKNFELNNSTFFGLNSTTNDWAINGKSGGNNGVWIQGDDATNRLRLYSGLTATRNSEIRLYPDSAQFNIGNGAPNFDSLRTASSMAGMKVMVRGNGGGIYEIPKDSIGVSDGDKGDVRVTNTGTTWAVDTVAVTPIKIAESYDKQRGPRLATIFEQATFADLDTFTVTTGGGYSTATVGGGTILMGDGSTDAAEIRLNRYSMLQRWTTKARFVVGERSADSYLFRLFMYSDNTTFVQDIAADFRHRSTGGYDGYIDIYSGNHSSSFSVIATSTTNVVFSQDDEIEFTLNRNLNVFTATARNVTTGGAEVSVSYVYNGLETAVNTGRPGMAAVGRDSVSYFSFYSDESKNSDIMLVGDSKFTWYGNFINQSIPSLMYGKYGNVINHSGSGDKTAEVLLTLEEIISLTPKQVLLNIGSNDIRNGISSGTWRSNIDTIYNRLTRNGIDVYFALAYETSISQTTLRNYFLSNYPGNYIDEPYQATLNCGSCLISDNVHLNAYGDEKWVDAVGQSGMMDFSTSTSVFKEMKFRAGDTAPYTQVGDSTILSRYFSAANKINVFREGELQWEVSSYEPYSYERSGSTVTFHPPLATGERVIIQSYSQVQWVTIQPDTVAIVEEFVVFNTAGDLTQSPTGTWSSAAGTGKGYSTKSLATGDDGYFLIKNTDGTNTVANPVGLDDDADNVDDFTAMEYVVYNNGGGTYSYIDNGGSVTNSGVAAGANEWLRLRKEGTTVYAEYSSDDGANWNPIHTYSLSAGHTLYAKAHLVAATKKIIDASIYNFY